MSTTTVQTFNNSQLSPSGSGWSKFYSATYGTWAPNTAVQVDVVNMTATEIFGQDFGPTVQQVVYKLAAQVESMGSSCIALNVWRNPPSILGTGTDQFWIALTHTPKAGYVGGYSVPAAWQAIDRPAAMLPREAAGYGRTPTHGFRARATHGASPVDPTATHGASPVTPYLTIAPATSGLPATEGVLLAAALVAVLTLLGISGAAALFVGFALLATTDPQAISQLSSAFGKISSGASSGVAKTATEWYVVGAIAAAILGVLVLVGTAKTEKSLGLTPSVSPIDSPHVAAPPEINMSSGFSGGGFTTGVATGRGRRGHFTARASSATAAAARRAA